MSNPYFQFKQFAIFHERCAMKVNTDSVLLGSWADITNTSSILDIGTGSGLIAIMMAQRSNAEIDAVEIEQAACEQASENISNCPWSKRIHLFHSSFQEYAKQCDNKYDLIVSNPPYFVNSLRPDEKNRTIARHNDTLIHSELMNYSSLLLAERGHLAVILPHKEGNIFIAKALNNGLYCRRKTLIKHFEGQEVKRVLLDFSGSPVNTVENIIVIESINRKGYTEKYKSLVKDFYLDF